MTSPEPNAKDWEIAQAASDNVALFDLSDRTQIELTGSDRSRFLHGFTTNDIKRLKPGQGCETFLTSLKGKIVAHLFVFCAQDSLWLDGTPGQQETVQSHLGKFLIVDDVQLISRGSERGEVFVTGPLAADLLQLEQPLGVCDHVTREIAGGTFEIRRVDLLGTPGYLMSVPRQRLETVKLGLRTLGVVEGSRDQFESLRIECGFPCFGVDITEDYLAQEAARTRQCVSFNKGCYLGQETIARLDALGHTNRELRRLRFDTNALPASGQTVFDQQDAEVGVITSAAPLLTRDASAQSDQVCAIGLMKRAACEAGTTVKIRFEDRVAAGRVI